MQVLITGMAGFIGMHLAQALVSRGHKVVGFDNLSSITYPSSLKEDRLKALGFAQIPAYAKQETAQDGALTFMRLDLTDQESVQHLIQGRQFDAVVNLAALAGVRLSTQEPEAYFRSNADGFFNVLEAVRAIEQDRRPRLIFASSSSVYGDCTHVPFSEDDCSIEPVSVYAATKRINELIAQTYALRFNIDATALRFFTVYGPWGRPDMAPFIFTKAMLAGQPIRLFNEGRLRRDFTYVDDIVEGLVRIVEGSGNAPKHPAKPYAVYNIGNGTPIELFDFVHELEMAAGVKAQLIMEPMQPGDVHQTYADVRRLQKDYGFTPHTALHDGIGRFFAWYQDYYGRT